MTTARTWTIFSTSEAQTHSCRLIVSSRISGMSERSHRTSTVRRRTLVGVALMVAGVAIAVLGTTKLVFNPDGLHASVFTVGRVVDVAGDRVELSYMLDQVERRGFAYPDDSGSLRVGDFVGVGVSPNRPDRALIPGTEHPSTWGYVLWAGVGFVIVLVGLSVVIRSLARWAPLDRAFPRIRWISERHGA